MYVLAAMLPVLLAPIEYAVPSEAVNVPAPHATVSASVTENAQSCVHPRNATFTAAETTEAAARYCPSTDDPACKPERTTLVESVIDANVAAPAFETLAGAAAKVAAPSHMFPSISTWKDEASAPPISIVDADNAPAIVREVPSHVSLLPEEFPSETRGVPPLYSIHQPVPVS